jgi:hypothetical protein
MPSRRTGLRPSACGPQTLPVSLHFTCPSRSLWRLSSHPLAHPSSNFVVLVEWRILDLALSLYGKVIVPLYENFGPDSIGASVIPSHICTLPTNNFSRVHVGFSVARLSIVTYTAQKNSKRSASTTQTSASSSFSPQTCPRCLVYPRNFRP